MTEINDDMLRNGAKLKMTIEWSRKSSTKSGSVTERRFFAGRQGKSGTNLRAKETFDHYGYLK